MDCFGECDCDDAGDLNLLLTELASICGGSSNSADNKSLEFEKERDFGRSLGFRAGVGVAIGSGILLGIEDMVDTTEGLRGTSG